MTNFLFSIFCRTFSNLNRRTFFVCRSRKRRPSYSQDGDLLFNSPAPNGDDPMDACNAALVLMSLSCSPHSPHWTTAGLGSSPGGSSSASWCSGSSSPPLSEEGVPAALSPNRIRTTSLSTSDEGIVMDYNEETPRKRRVSQHIFILHTKSKYIILYNMCYCGIVMVVHYRLQLRSIKDIIHF